jgi:hypothetical protein
MLLIIASLIFTPPFGATAKGNQAAAILPAASGGFRILSHDITNSDY